MGEAAQDSGALPRFLTIAAAAKRYGFKSPLACKRFCLRNAVPIRSVGKLRFVSPADLEALIAGERSSSHAESGASGAAPLDASRVDDCMMRLTRGAR